MEPRADVDAVAQPLWMLLAESRGARLVVGRRTPAGRLHFDAVASLEEQWDEFQHGRPSRRTGKDTNHYAAEHHEQDERRERFARALAKWLDDQVAARGIERLTIFAGDKLLGSLRKHLSPPLRRMADERHGDLGYVTEGDLPKHPAIRDLVDPPR